MWGEDDDSERDELVEVASQAQAERDREHQRAEELRERCDMLAASLGDVLAVAEHAGAARRILDRVYERVQPWFTPEYAAEARRRLGWR